MFLKLQKRSLAFLLALVLLLSTFMSTAIIPASAAETDVADVAADTEVADTAADVDTAEESAQNDVADVAADADVADEAAAADVAPVGEDTWVPIEGITVPAELSVETESTYRWVYDSTVGALEGNSGSAPSTANYYTYLKITNNGDQAGVFSFDYQTTTPYLQAAYGVLLYKKGAKPAYSATGCDNYLKATEFCGKMSDFVTCDAAVLQPGESIYLASYRQYTNQNPKLWVKNFTFDTEYTQPVITLSESDKGWFASTNNYNAAHVTSFTGEVGQLAGTVYAIPNVEQGYKFDGLYTTPDFQEGTKVSPSGTSYSTSRTFNLFYSKQDVTYYPKFTKQEKSASYHVTYDPAAFSSVSYTLVSSLNSVYGYMTDQQSLSSINKVTAIAIGDTVTVYPGDSIKFNYTVKGDYSSSGITVDGSTDYNYTYNNNQSTTINLTRAKDTVQELAISSVNIAYYEIEGFTSDDVTVMTRPQYLNDTMYATNYPWTAENGVLKNGNTQHEEWNSDCSLMKMVAKKSGALIFDFRLNCPEAAESWGGMTYYGILAVQKLSDSDTDAIFDPWGDGVSAFDSYYYGNYSKWTTAYVMVEEGDEIGLIYYTDGSPTDDFAEITNVRISSGPKTITYSSSNEECGTVVANGLNDGVGTVGETVTLTATSTGGQFVSWQQKVGDEWVVVGTDQEYTFTIVDNAEYRAMFAPALEGEAVASVNSAKFSSLNDAVACAANGDTVILLKNYTQNEDLTIPAGVTLLVPFDAAYTSLDASNHYPPTIAQKAVTLTDNAYVTLTLAAGKKIITNGGTIIVNSTVPSTTPNSPSAWNGNVYGAYGLVVMETGSQIILNGSSEMYVFGFVIGDGDVLVNDTSTVSEHFAIEDWPGGSASSSMKDTEEFPFNQYYIQNIECRMTLQSTARENVFISIYIPSWGGSTQSLYNEFIGPSGMFVPADGTSITKWYNPAEDKIYYTINGDAALGSIEVYGFSSDAYYLPINNIDVTVTDGTLTANNKVIFLQGSSLNIAQDAALDITSDGKLVFADKDFTGYSFPGNKKTNSRIPIRFTPSRTPRAKEYSAAEWNALAPATINNNGTVIVEDGGSLSSTSGGANLTSSAGTGVYIINGDNTPPSLKVHNTNNKTADAATVEMTEAVLRNENGESLDTSVARWFDDNRTTAFSQRNGVWGDYRYIEFYASGDAFDEIEDPVFDRSADPVSPEELSDYVADHNITMPDFVSSEDGYTYEWKAWEVYDAYDDEDAGSVVGLVPVYEKKTFNKHSLTLDGKIGVNFYLLLPDGYTADDTLMDFSWGNKYITINTYSDTEPYSEPNVIGVNDGNFVKYTVYVAAKELNDDITAVLKDKNTGSEIARETYSGTDYAYQLLDMTDAQLNAIAKNGNGTGLRATVVSMLNYCAASQVNFEYHTTALANDQLSDADKQLADVDTASVPAPAFGDVSWGWYYGSSVNLGSDNAYSVYLVKNSYDTVNPAITYDRGADSKMRDDLTGDCAITENYQAIRATVYNIPAAEVLKNITLKIDGAAHEVNIGSYIKTVIDPAAGAADALKNAATALYHYGTAAQNYFV